MLNNKTILIIGGAGKIGSSFSKSIIKNRGKIIVGDIVSQKIGKKLIKDLGEKNSSFF